MNRCVRVSIEMQNVRTRGGMIGGAVLQACVHELLGVALKIEAQAPALDFVETVLHILLHICDCFGIIHVKEPDLVTRFGYVIRAAGRLDHRRVA